MTKAEKIAAAVENLERYLVRVAKWSEEHKRNNCRSWQDAMNMSAWLSVYKFGNKEYSEQAGRIILSIFER